MVGCLASPAGGQDVGDMRVEGRTLGASDLNSHPAGKPWKSQDRGCHHGARAAADAWEERAASTIGGMDRQLISFFPWPATDCHQCSALQKPRGLCRENFKGKRPLLNTTNDRMSGTLDRYRLSPILLVASKQRQESGQCRAAYAVVERGCHDAPEIR